MDDRQPTPGQEGRVLITPEDGSPPFYAKLEMADNPLNAGTPLCKLTLLSDEACDFLDIPRTSVPSDAFIKLSFGTKMYGYRITLLTAGGRPASGVTIKGITLPDGRPCVTDKDGRVLGVATATATISIESPYTDCENISQAVESSGNVITDVILSFSRSGTQAATIDTSRDLRFSPDVEYIDACAIGAGSSGWRRGDTGGIIGAASGAGGSIENRFNIQYSGELISVAVGANNEAYAAGNTIISGLGNDIVGEGATAASWERPPSPSKSKNGGNGQLNGDIGLSGPGSNGFDRTAFPFDDESILCSGGGGTGGMREDPDGTGYPGGAGGKSGGGAGGTGGGYSGNPGYPGKYYGSGGGAPGLSIRNDYGDGGEGKDGAAMFRWRYRA